MRWLVAAIWLCSAPGSVARAQGRFEEAPIDSLLVRAERAARQSRWAACESLATDAANRLTTRAPSDPAPVDSAAVGRAWQLVIEGRLGTESWRQPDTPLLGRGMYRLRDRALEPDDPARSRLEAFMARLERRLGEYHRAVGHAENALNLNRRLRGDDHLETAKAWGNLSVMRRFDGDIEAAVDAAREALRIFQLEANHGDPGLTLAQYNLGIYLQEAGDPAGAEPHLEEALALTESAAKPDSLEIAGKCHGLAILRLETGEVDRARPLEARALAIRERLLPADDYRLGQSLTTMANIVRAEDRLHASLPLYERALEVAEAAYGPDNPGVLSALLNLSNVMILAGDATRAELYARRHLNVVRTALGVGHPLEADGLEALSAVLLAREELDGAARASETALAIRTQTLGPEHPSTAFALRRWALVQAALGRTGAALDALVRCESIARRNLALALRAWPERQALLYANEMVRGDARALTLLSRPDLRDQAEPMWDQIVRSRAQVLDALAARRRVSARASDEGSARLEALQRTARDLARALVQGDAVSPAARDSLERRRDLAERALAEESADERSAHLTRTIGLAEVRAQLRPGTALVAYVRYDSVEVARLAPAEVAPGGRSDFRSAHYGAFLLTGPEAVARFEPLGDGERIEAALRAWREALDPAHEAPADPAEAQAAGHRIRRLIWDPVARELGPVSEVYVVWDGALQGAQPISWPDLDGTPLVLTGPLFHVLTAERDLVPIARSRSLRPTMLAFGGIDFDAGGASSAGRTVSGGTAPFRGAAPDCVRFQDVHFEALPGSRQEVERVESIWRRAQRGGRATVWTGDDATEAAFKRHAPEYRVVHLATHGFFVDTECLAQAPEGRGLGGLGRPTGGAHDRAPSREANPLRLAGVALAGANRRATVGPEEEDGIVTAEEIATLDLSGVDCAVLSGCETGRGDLVAAEGLSGLRRAFRLAGARAVVASLWSVNDLDAATWMEAFYRARYTDRLSIAAAAQRASREAREALIARGEAPSAARWAAFVATSE
ncbi:MAG: CHAT domain-containing protein [Candidatus Eisenbacteria bacterium]|nr:CHAT domain-containing protein [Candidatus Eisenbacteria bacterium]